MMAALVAVLVGVLFVACTLAAFQLLGRYIYGYSLRGDRIDIRVFRFVRVGSISLRGIDAIREVTVSEALESGMATLRLGNRIFGRGLELRRNSGMFRTILITPDDPDAILAQWRSLHGQAPQRQSQSPGRRPGRESPDRE